MKNVMLKIEGVQLTDDGEESVIEFMTEGKIYEKEKGTYIVYKESEISGMEGCTTTLKLFEGKISMKRFGAANSEMFFEKGKKYKSNYATPYGSFNMEIVTKKVLYEKLNEKRGRVYIEYAMDLQGMLKSNNSLNISIM